LYAVVRDLRPFSPTAQQAIEALVDIQPESELVRQERYEDLFMGNGRPHLWLYESMVVNGRLLGPETQKLALLYQAAGLQIVSSELPDHASMELSFLGYVAEMQANDPENRWRWQKLERDFIKKHAGRWLPDLGRALARSGDEVYAPIGKLLVGWLEEALRPPRKQKTAVRLPIIPVEQDCTLCGFCVQVCPTKALAVYETEQETSLLLSAAACIGCSKCEHICDPQAIDMATISMSLVEQRPPSPQPSPSEGEGASSLPFSGGGLGRGPGITVLRRSPRAACLGCGRPLVSQAELDYVAIQLGHPAWLDYCMECRAQVMMERV
jgi:ferredoxin/TorA maturation chaperone TorD